MDSRMSESPASVITITATLWSLPQAVPRQFRIKRMLTQFDIVSVEVVDLSLREHSVVLQFSSSDGGAVVRYEDQSSLALSHGLDG